MLLFPSRFSVTFISVFGCCQLGFIVSMAVRVCVCACVWVYRILLPIHFVENTKLTLLFDCLHLFRSPFIWLSCYPFSIACMCVCVCAPQLGGRFRLWAYACERLCVCVVSSVAEILVHVYACGPQMFVTESKPSSTLTYVWWAKQMVKWLPGYTESSTLCCRFLCLNTNIVQLCTAYTHTIIPSERRLEREKTPFTHTSSSACWCVRVLSLSHLH